MVKEIKTDKLKQQEKEKKKKKWVTRKDNIM